MKAQLACLAITTFAIVSATNSFAHTPSEQKWLPIVENGHKVFNTFQVAQGAAGARDCPTRNCCYDNSGRVVCR